MKSKNKLQKKDNSEIRPPVVVVLGHVDHGKSSILESIRDLKITQKEAGGITQHIGAYEIKHKDKKITFIDTPGHEAFSAMRQRGAQVADIAILVIDAAEGVRPQTKEAILAVKKAGIPMIVALNKMDKPKADPKKVRGQLTEEDVLVESRGGKVPTVEISAKTGEGIDELLELISLLAEMEQLEEDLESPPEGTVIESYLDNFRGPTATLILRKGTLEKKKIIVTSRTYAKVKSVENFKGQEIDQAKPSQPIVVLGFEEVPQVGEIFKGCSSIKEATEKIEEIEEKKEDLSSVFVVEEDQEVLNIVLKADVLGSLGAIESVLKSLPQEKVILRILKAKVGEINESDVKTAEMSGASIIGFRVKMNNAAKKILEKREDKKINIKRFDVIYELVQEVRKLMKRKIIAEIERRDLGKVKVLVIFRTRKTRQITGGKVIDGEVRQGAKIEVQRNKEKVGEGKIINLQQNKKDTERLKRGEECGILYEGNTKIQKGDVLIVYVEEKKKVEI